MSNTKNIVVLCNNRMAFPAIQTLHGSNKLHTIGVVAGNEDVLSFCSLFAAQTGINLMILEKETLESQLEELFEKNTIKYVFTMTFPWKLSEKLIQKHPNRFYNFHYGLLPEMRGCDPVFESVRRQQKETGITIHAIEKEIDKGAVILKRLLPIDATITHGILCTKLSYLGQHIIPEVLTLLESNSKTVLQDETTANYYKKPTASDVCINWKNQDANTIEALVRACNPWNKGAYIQWNSWNIRVLEASPTDHNSEIKENPGTILKINEDTGLVVQCYNDTQLRINIVYTDEGFMSGHKLLAYGLQKGEQFANL